MVGSEGSTVSAGLGSSPWISTGPRPGGHAPALDEVLEAVEIAADAVIEEAEPVSDLLDEPLGVGIHDEPDLGAPCCLARERDGAIVLDTVDALPGDPVGWGLVGDACPPGLGPTGDRRRPVEGTVIDLDHLVHAFHERREGLELGPLPVDGIDGRVDRDGLLDA